MAKIGGTEKIALAAGAGLLLLLGVPALLGKKSSRRKAVPPLLFRAVGDEFFSTVDTVEYLMGSAAETCATVKGTEVLPSTEVTIDATQGSPAAVDELLLCLSDLGYSNVISFSE